MIYPNVPVLQRGDPLAKDLIFAFTPWHTSANINDLRRNLAGSVNGSVPLSAEKLGNSYYFNGSVSNYLSFPSNDQYEGVNWLGSLTLCVWARLDNTTGFMHFFGKHASNGSFDNPFDFRTDATANNLYLVRTGTGGGPKEYVGPATLKNAWTHYAVCFDGLISNGCRFFVNGVGITATGGASVNVTGSNAPLRLGVRTDGAVKLIGSALDYRVYQGRKPDSFVRAVYEQGPRLYIPSRTNLSYLYGGGSPPPAVNRRRMILSA